VIGALDTHTPSSLRVGHDRAVDWLTDAGLGLDHDTLRLDRTTQTWIDAGSLLRDQVASNLIGLVAGVEPIGSSSVLGLLAKPIVDLAVGLAADQDITAVRDRLQAAGWIYRGDAGADGGHVFVLETRPWYRVAHVHVVDFAGEQWRNYLRLRNVLRGSADARAQYESVKRRLAAERVDDRRAYTGGKSAIVSLLLEESPERADDVRRG
jgi:GrpB-like predicted nucleotidyltransferase (UPF0157 family)